MGYKKESAISPAVAVILIAAMTCLMATITGVVFLGMADISINDKRVSMNVDISDGKITMTPVYNSAIDILNGYTTYLSINDDELVYSFYPGTVNVINSEGKFGINDLSFIIIIGHFNDGSDEVIFTGKVVDGKIVSTDVTNRLCVTFIKIYEGSEEVIKTVSVDKGSTVSALSNVPKNAENTIDCWYKDPEFTDKWDMDSKVTKDVILYAQEYYPYFRDDSKVYSNTDELIAAINSWKKGTIKEDGTICKDIPIEGGAITINGELSLTGGDLISTTDSGLGYPTDRKPHIWASPNGVSGNLINLNGGGTLKIDGNMVIDGNGKMSNSIINMGTNSALNINSGESIVQNGYSNGNGGGIYNSGTITVISGGKLTVRDNEAKGSVDNSGGGGIYNSGKIINYGITSVSDNKFTGTGDKVGGGGIYNTGTITVISGGELTVSGNTATEGGGGIYNTGTITNLDPDKILLDNNGAVNGGGIYNEKSGTGSDYCQIHVTVIGNTATNGGGIYNKGKYVEINGEISGNTATNHGGGIYNTGQSVKINGEISGNTATNHGGGIYNSAGTIIVTGKLIVQEKNKAKNKANNGGGIYTDRVTITVISGGKLTVSGNEATNYGGGIYNSAGIIDVYGTLIVSYNTAEKDGGGIYNTKTINAYSGSTLTVSGNKATTGNGGGINNYYKEIYVYSGSTLTVSGNKATSGYGGGIYNGGYGCKIYLNHDNDGNILSLIDSIYDNKANNGGGIWSSTNEVYYGGTKVSSLPDSNIKDWFQNDVDSTIPNTASNGNNYYPQLT